MLVAPSDVYRCRADRCCLALQLNYNVGIQGKCRSLDLFCRASAKSFARLLFKTMHANKQWMSMF